MPLASVGLAHLFMRDDARYRQNVVGQALLRQGQLLADQTSQYFESRP
jgi:hypothetical protein